MATLHSFYLEPELWQAPFTLKGTEAHHLTKVLRIKAGTQVHLFNGQGTQGLFTVEAIEKNCVALALCSEEYIPPRTNGCTLAAGYSKALRRGWFLEKAVELEASALWFWQGDYSQASVPDIEKQTWQASLVAGAKQCTNPWLPTLTAFPKGISSLLDKTKDFERTFILYEGDTKGKVITKEDLMSDGPILLIVGPEGGFSPREIQLLMQHKNKIQAVSLGARILRWETAAILTLGMAWWARQ